MQLITLTTDWGTRDYHVGALKGLLHSVYPGIAIVDISHQIASHNIQQAAYIFRNAYTRFPENTVHIIGVNGYLNGKTELLAIRKDGHGFIGMNDGFFSLVFGEHPPSNMVTVKTDFIPKPGFDLETLASTAAHLLEGQNIFELGNRPEKYELRLDFKPVIEEEVIRGVVIYIDEFGNVVTNIHKQLFEDQLKGRKFEIVTRKLTNSLDEIRHRYHEVEPGGMVALFNDAGLLEISINQGSASKLLGLKLNDNIRVEFK
ncbi:MAG TPA: SAM-dependent chlorinase/fluorinase [Bacteroidia bacterium]|jgi:S-adenosylmethionine hydrolase|nr:SAM-dependent chlorinase/fluorinase [Bacteroidia bacterium]HQK97409.1 SAM-dependent chlorinase/fluorinase [Bacteroidia bacterium]